MVVVVDKLIVGAVAIAGIVVIGAHHDDGAMIGHMVLITGMVYSIIKQMAMHKDIKNGNDDSKHNGDV